MNIVDIIVIGIILVSIIVGTSRGLMLSAFSIASYFIAIIVAIKFAPLVARLLGKTSLIVTIKTKISAAIDKIIENFINDTVEVQINQIVDKLHLSNSMQDIQSLKETSVTTTGMVDTLSDKISNLILLVIAFVIVYFVAKLALFLISELIKKTSKLPVIRSFDKLGGLLFGFFEGILIIWVLFMILFMFRASDTFKPVFDLIERSTIGNLLYKNNILLNIVSNYLSKIKI